MSDAAADLATLRARLSTVEAEVVRLRERSHKHADTLTGHEGAIDQVQESLVETRRDAADAARFWERRFTELLDDIRRRDADRDARVEYRAVTNSLERPVTWAMAKFIVGACLATAATTAAVILWVLKATGVLK